MSVTAGRPSFTPELKHLDAESWPAVLAELIRVKRRIDQIDDVIEVLEPLLAGFHGLGPGVQGGPLELFAAGVDQRERIDRLERDIEWLAEKLKALNEQS